MLEKLNISKSGYYDYLKRKPLKRKFYKNDDIILYDLLQ